MKVKLLKANMITCAKYFGDMTDAEKNTVPRPELYRDTDLLIDLSGTGKYTYHDKNDIEILKVTE